MANKIDANEYTRLVVEKFEGNFAICSTKSGAQFELDENWYDLKWGLKDDEISKAAFKKDVEKWTANGDTWKIHAPEILQVFGVW